MTSIGRKFPAAGWTVLVLASASGFRLYRTAVRYLPVIGKRVWMASGKLLPARQRKKGPLVPVPCEANRKKRSSQRPTFSWWKV